MDSFAGLIVHETTQITGANALENIEACSQINSR